MQMHCRFLICASNGWPSTCNCKCSDSAEGKFKLVQKKGVAPMSRILLWAKRVNAEIKFRKGQGVQFFLASACVPYVHARVYMFSGEWLLMHLHMGVHACVMCGVNFAVPLPPSPVMDNSTMRDGQPRKASAYFSQRFYEKFWLILWFRFLRCTFV